MASESFDKESEKKRPTVQIGDPFFEKLLIESCLEVMEQDLVVAIQDMGAAGLTSSSFEMASKGGVGFTLHLDRVPLRDDTLTPEDILLSESQERMLMIVEPSKLAAVQAVYARWGLDAVSIGEVTKDRVMRLYWEGEVLTSIDPDLLTEHSPRYDRPFEDWQPKHRVASGPLLKMDSKLKDMVLSALHSAEGTSREFIYRQYDGHVGASTAADCRESVGVVRLRDSGRGLAVVLGCRPHLMRFDAREGGRDAVAYPAIELASKGFETLAITDCLNFGNPERVEVMSSFVASLGGINELARELTAPIISGNVSFYNETEGQNITPTPSTGLVGLRPSVENLPSSSFEEAGLNVYLVSSNGDRPDFEFGGVWAEKTGQLKAGRGEIHAKNVKAFAMALIKLEHSGAISASRVVGKFGLPYAIARMSLAGGFGADLRIEETKADAFAESLYQVVVVSRLEKTEFAKRWSESGGRGASYLGTTGGTSLRLKLKDDACEIEVAELRRAYRGGWTEQFSTLKVLPENLGALV